MKGARRKVKFDNDPGSPYNTKTRISITFSGGNLHGIRRGSGKESYDLMAAD
jgi:hypothetical protein